MLQRLVVASVEMRGAMAALLVVLLGAGVWAAATLPVDAMPDVSTVQVSVLTKAGGLSAVETENTVSVPIENALNGVPGAVELRSMADSGVASVTVVFDDATDPWFARTLVLERLRGIEGLLPPNAGTPELAPISSGLGEIYTFVVRSKHHTAMQLRTLLDWDIVPKLRGVKGVVEVNTMGGELKQYVVAVDRARLNAQGMSLSDVVNGVRAANQNAGGGYLDRGSESYVVRGEGLLKDEADIGAVVLRAEQGQAPVLVRHVAEVKVAPALRYGVITHGGEGEAVSGTVMMLLGSNSRDVVQAVGEKVEAIRRELPPGVAIDTIYDRSDFVGRTIRTVAQNLLEGILIVTVVLALFLGTVRGALAVVLGIPASMSVALLGMHLFGVPGDLMSLGAIDFGFLVDGPIVVLEAVVVATTGRALVGAAKAKAFAEVAALAARPVGFAVAIIMLVYLPLLTLEGVEGKMFRPMALTMALALLGALTYALVFFPAMLVLLVPAREHHGPKWMDAVVAACAKLVQFGLAHRGAVLLTAVAALALTAWRFGALGAEFVPRIFEGDAVVTIRRAPSISIAQARELDLAAEKVLHRFPEVLTTLAMTGRAEVAIDIVGADNTDMLVRLKPIEQWTTAHTFDGLSEHLKDAIEREVPGTYVSVSQPIEDKTNELISGSRADVSIQIYGATLEELSRLAAEMKELVRGIDGTGDVRVERILGQPVINAVANRERMATYGVKVEDAFAALASTREGVPAGQVYEGARRFDVRVIQAPESPTAEALARLPVETMAGETVRLGDVVDVTESDGAAAVRRVNRARAVRVDVNLRGRDLLSWVNEAQATVKQKLSLPSGYRVEWGGQFENFDRAQARLRVVVPVVLAIIFSMLLLMFRDVRLTAAVFATVPLSLTGGMLGLWLRGMPFSLSAAVGFIALAGITVLNGVVIGQQVQRLLAEGKSLAEAVRDGTVGVVRAVLTTAAVAALGFLPMALA
ncbi:MAG: CusA/CzcA family heavy metal efflux RND transporter, partial [Myxococcaceae bacterium]|nr:CusA/CzcA family heavy metal efflux RND transporter [Myxococcaceae bacterium]